MENEITEVVPVETLEEVVDDQAFTTNHDGLKTGLVLGGVAILGAVAYEKVLKPGYRYVRRKWNEIKGKKAAKTETKPAEIDPNEITEEDLTLDNKE